MKSSISMHFIVARYIRKINWVWPYFLMEHTLDPFLKPIALHFGTCSCSFQKTKSFSIRDRFLSSAWIYKMKVFDRFHTLRFISSNSSMPLYLGFWIFHLVSNDISKRVQLLWWNLRVKKDRFFVLIAKKLVCLKLNLFLLINLPYFGNYIFVPTLWPVKRFSLQYSLSLVH